MSDFVGEQSRVHIMPISAKWKHKSSIHIGFIVFNGGVTTFFAKSVPLGKENIAQNQENILLNLLHNDHDDWKQIENKQTHHSQNHGSTSHKT